MKVAIDVERKGESVIVRIRDRVVAVLAYGESWSGEVDISLLDEPTAGDDRSKE